MRWHNHHFPILFLLICLSVASSQRGSNSRGFSSPVRELGPSLAASVAGGTIIAVRSPRRKSSGNNDADTPKGAVEEYADHGDDDDCLVILFRSPIVSESGATTKQRLYSGNLTVSSVFGNGADDGLGDLKKRKNSHHGLSFLPDGPVNFPFLPSSGSSNLRVLHASSGLIVAATGFAPDADHILNVAAGRVLSRISVFDAPSPMSSLGSKSVDPHRLVREDLSSMMIDAAMSDGGRPLGVQLLVVGQSALYRRASTADDRSLEIYTVDPSGGWRSVVGSGAAVGRGAERVRSSLRQETLDSPTISSLGATNEHRGWRGALDRAMMASIIALDQDGDTSNDADDERGGSKRSNYGAVVIFGPPLASRSKIRSSRCAMVSSVAVEESYNSCHLKLVDRSKLAK